MEPRHAKDRSINTRCSSKRQMAWKKFTNANKMQTKKYTRKHIELSRSSPFSASRFDIIRYFGDDEDVVDETLAPEEEAGQFTFGTTVGQTGGRQQFSFGEDVNMT